MRLKNLISLFSSPKNVPLIPHQGSQPDPSLEGLPDFVEPLLGWRTWTVWVASNSPDGCPSLGSVVLDTSWAPRSRAVAEHNFDLGARCRGLLDLDCSCGIYAFKDPADAFTYLMQVRNRLMGRSVDVALGAVSLWGKVIECERGYRAQYAYPRHFYLPASFVRFLGKVSFAFGVSAGVYASTKQDEITLTISSGVRTQARRMLHLKNSELFSAQGVADEFGFYDLEGWPGLGNIPFKQCPNSYVPNPGASEGPYDTPRV